MFIVCLFCGLLFGVVLCQPEINRQRNEITNTRTQISSLQTQIDDLESSRLDLMINIEVLQGDLESKNTELIETNIEREALENQVNELESTQLYLVDQLETLQELLESTNAELTEKNDKLELLENAIEYLSPYIQRDLEFLSLLSERLENYPFMDPTLLLELREASYDVDPSIASTINIIMDDIEVFNDWSTRMPPESASFEERYTWLLEGYQVLGRYLIDYREFVKSFLEPIEAPLKGISTLSLAD